MEWVVGGSRLSGYPGGLGGEKRAEGQLLRDVGSRDQPRAVGREKWPRRCLVLSKLVSNVRPVGSEILAAGKANYSGWCPEPPPSCTAAGVPGGEERAPAGMSPHQSGEIWMENLLNSQCEARHAQSILCTRARGRDPGHEWRPNNDTVPLTQDLGLEIACFNFVKKSLDHRKCPGQRGSVADWRPAGPTHFGKSTIWGC